MGDSTDGMDGASAQSDGASVWSARSAYSVAEHARAASEEFAALLDTGEAYGDTDLFQQNIQSRMKYNRENTMYPTLDSPPQANDTGSTDISNRRDSGIANRQVNNTPDAHDGVSGGRGSKHSALSFSVAAS